MHLPAPAAPSHTCLHPVQPFRLLATAACRVTWVEEDRHAHNLAVHPPTPACTLSPKFANLKRAGCIPAARGACPERVVQVLQERLKGVGPICPQHPEHIRSRSASWVQAHSSQHTGTQLTGTQAHRLTAHSTQAHSSQHTGSQLTLLAHGHTGSQLTAHKLTADSTQAHSTQAHRHTADFAGTGGP